MRLPKFDCAILVITRLKILVYCVCFENNYKCELSSCDFLGYPSCDFIEVTLYFLNDSFKSKLMEILMNYNSRKPLTYMSNN